MPHVDHVRKHVVIVGGGFAGLAAALRLEKLRQKDDRFNVTLIDKECYHLYHALLYEVATASIDINEKELEALQSGVCIRIKALQNLLLKKQVNVVQDEVTGIDVYHQRIAVKGGPDIPYDYAIVALGSEANYYGIPGLAEHSVSLKELPDALKIHLQLDKLFEQAARGQPCRIVIGGGGVSGVEVAGELQHYLNRLEGQKFMNSKTVAVHLMEAGPSLLTGMDSWVQRTATERLRSLGVHIHLGQPITEVTDTTVRLKDGTTHPYNLFVWAGGIHGHHVFETMGVPLEGKRQIRVQPTLQIPDVPSTFVVGDGALFIDPTSQRPVPQTAPIAITEGQAAADNVYRLIRNVHPASFTPHHPGFVIPIGGRWAISTVGMPLAGVLGWCSRKAVDLHYFMSIMPLRHALRVLWQGGRVYLQND